MTSTKRLLVDADEFLFRACVSNERELAVGDMHILHSDWAAVKYTLDLLLHDLKEETGCTEMVMALSSPRNYRKDLTETYKAHRKATRKPMCLQRAIDHIRENYNYLELEGCEADDVLGVYSPEFDAIVSSDKDLRTIPGRLYNPGKKVWEVITQDESDRMLCYQALVGDSADGFKGCAGIGPKRADALLAKEGDYYDLAREAFEKAGHDEEYCLLQFRLARILRPGEFDFDAEAPRLMSFKVAS